MVNTQLRFFYFAGSVVGGIVFLGNTILFIIALLNLIYPNTIESFSESPIINLWLGVYLFSLAIIVGMVISEMGIKFFYYKNNNCEEIKSFRKDLSKKTGIKLSDLNKSRQRDFIGELRHYLAFAHNAGHPTELYDIAGRARLAGSAALNTVWMSLIFILLFIATFWSHGDLKFSILFFQVLLVIFLVLSASSSYHLSKMAKKYWLEYWRRLDLFTVYRYANGELIFSNIIQDTIKKTKPKKK